VGARTGGGLLHALKKGLHGLPIIAEDLGVITPPVDALRRSFGLPGMLILQFAFQRPDNRFLPAPPRAQHVGLPRHARQRHDGGLVRGGADHEKQFMHRYLGDNGNDVAWTLIRWRGRAWRRTRWCRCRIF